MLKQNIKETNLLKACAFYYKLYQRMSHAWQAYIVVISASFVHEYVSL
jgi:hypothetical protein